ncbi:hypothetical protein DMA11_04620 [Marinilabiliaceae bacterium JC017]|nr:hypothetical protein DMA11_04620 [Marinilabiliaceae bacterium JC017]
MIMEFKIIEAQKVFCETVTTTLKDICKLVGDKPAQLMQEAADAGFEIAGPQIWMYKGADGNPDTTFTLTIGIPVTTGERQHEKVKTLPSFSCAAGVMNGPWEQFSEFYPQLIGDVCCQEKSLTGISREVYHVVDFQNPANNVTEVQIGIQ